MHGTLFKAKISTKKLIFWPQELVKKHKIS
jgi:hypothetical protein